MDAKPTVAVVGAGVAGLTAAWLLSRKYKVTVYEKNRYLGGHTCTVTVPDGDDAGTPVDMGFIVMNARNYPVLTRILDELGVERRDSNMSFSYHDESTGYVYAGHNLDSLFARRKNLLSPAHWGMIRDILRFNRCASEDLLEGRLRKETLGEYLERGRYGAAFADRYLFAMGSAIWSAPHAEITRFPAEPFIHFFYNHGLLSVKGRPQWQYVVGGSHSYIAPMRASFDEGVFLDRAAARVRRVGDGAEVVFEDGGTASFDHVVIGAHADEALNLLESPTALEQELLGPWHYQLNHAVLHTDDSIMPPVPSAWSSWNFTREPAFTPDQPVSVTYHMNRLQALDTRHQYMVTLNRQASIPDEKVIRRVDFTHPAYSFSSMDSQSRLPELNRQGGIYFCGSYFGYGFHEDGARAGKDAAEALGVAL